MSSLYILLCLWNQDIFPKIWVQECLSPNKGTDDEPVEGKEESEEDRDEQSREDVPVENVDREKLENSGASSRDHLPRL